MKRKIALVEDHPVGQNTFKQKVGSLADVELVFVVENGNEFLEKLKGLPPARLPEVVFMDLQMPGMGGAEAISMAKPQHPSMHFIVLTIFDDDDHIFEAIQAGAIGYLLKHEPAAVVAEAIQSALTFGGAPMSPPIARKVLQLLSQSSGKQAEQEIPKMPASITEREKEILLHMVSGWDAKRISSELGISVLTVRKHIDNIYRKLHVNSRAQVINLAHKKRWV